MQFSVKADVAEVLKYLDDVQRKQVPFATALALNKTARVTRDRIRRDMPKYLDQPTAFTVRGVLSGGRGHVATKRNLTAEVWIRDEASKGTPPIKYLAPQIYGGGRKQKSSERQLKKRGKLDSGYMVPARHLRNARGNITKGKMTQILSAVQGFTEVGYMANRTGRSARRNKGKQKQHFVAKRGNRRTGHLAPGIWERTASGRIRPALIQIRAPYYRKRLPFFELADRYSRQVFPREFAVALNKALATAKR